MKSVHDVIIRPVLTEKAYDGFADKKYVFEVAIIINVHFIVKHNSELCSLLYH